MTLVTPQLAYYRPFISLKHHLLVSAAAAGVMDGGE